MRKIVKLKKYQIIKYMYRYIQIGDTTCIYTIEDTINYSNLLGEKIGNKNLNGIMGLASTHISYHKRFGHKRILKDAEIPVIKEDLEKTNPIYPT